MAGRLFLLFLVLPAVEIYLLVKIGGVIGALPTIALLISTALVGSVMARTQGLRVVREAQEALAREEVPQTALLEGILVFAAGLLLVAPGVLTDLAGVVLLIPATRRIVAARLGAALRRRFVVATRFDEVSFHRWERGGDPDVIDVEAEDVEDDDERPKLQ